MGFEVGGRWKAGGRLKSKKSKIMGWTASFLAFGGLILNEASTENWITRDGNFGGSGPLCSWRKGDAGC